MPTPTYADETLVRAAFQRMVEDWGDPARYAAAYAPDAIHISTGGRLARGRSEIADAHAAALSAWAGGGTLTGRVDRLRFLTADVALLTVYSDVRFPAVEPRRVIGSLTAQRIGGAWRLVTGQYTRLGSWPRTGEPPAESAAAPESAAPATSTAPATDTAAATQIRALYDRMLGCWLDAPAYAECFTPDADYVTGGGKLERGWYENVEGHGIIFSAWARGSRLAGRIDELRFLTPDVAFVTAYGNIVFPDPDTPPGKRTVYALVAQQRDGGWTFAGYQNTPLVDGG